MRVNADPQESEPDKFAVLVLAYRAPAVLEKCLAMLEDRSIHFFVHLDRKAALSEFSFLGAASHASLIPQRFDVYWGGFNMVRAELALLNFAYQYDGYKRFILISDDSFPLLSAAKLRKALLSDANWLDQHKTKKPGYLKRYDEFYYFDSAATDARYRPPEDRNIGADQLRDLKELESLLRLGKKPIKQLYQGSQWWCLSRAAVDYLLPVVRNDSHLHESFRFSLVPDEHYIHTIIGNSEQNWSIRPSHMYFDFSKDPKPFVYSDIEQLERALSSDRLFVRKVAGDRSLLETLADRIAK